MSDVIIYENENGDIKVDVTFEDKSIWLSQKQMSDVFGKSVKTINEHISNIFADKELFQDAVIRNFRTTANDGKNYNVNHYNLDMIIAVGFRVKSPPDFIHESVKNPKNMGFTFLFRHYNKYGLERIGTSISL